jgi:uncharacterized protein DUF6151
VSHPLQCRCGAVKGSLADAGKANHVVCYCRDCQAFAHFLGEADAILDERGGSDIIQVLPKRVTFSQGADKLACMRLTGKGMLRWYASCCRTPIGNTLATPKLAFIGLLHTCLEAGGGPSLRDAFGPVRVYVYTKRARGEAKRKDQGQGAMLAWFFGTVLPARFNGDYRVTPFFDVATGTPIATPRVLSAEEHAQLMSSLRS